MSALTWSLREPPLPPEALYASREVAPALAGRLLKLSDARLQALKGVKTATEIVILGQTENLPWVDGALYLGQPPHAPGLWIPTTAQPDFPEDLLFHRLKSLTNAPPPWAWIPSSHKIIPLGSALPLSRNLLLPFLRPTEAVP